MKEIENTVEIVGGDWLDPRGEVGFVATLTIPEALAGQASALPEIYIGK